MSYCRWSSMDHQCDLYVYQGIDGGYSIHVAGKKRSVCKTASPYSKDALKILTDGNRDEWRKLLKSRDDEIANQELTPIGLPCDGMSFGAETAIECAEKCQELMDMGYIAPDGLVNDILGEE